MSQFEYVSVALSLVYALAIAEIMRGIVPSMRSEERYWPQVIALSGMLPFIAAAWWAIWNANGVDWTGIRFFYLLAMACIVLFVTMMFAGQFDDNNSRKISFERSIKRIFYIQAVYFSLAVLSPWVLGTVPFGETTSIQFFTAPYIVIFLIAPTFMSPVRLALLKGSILWIGSIATLALLDIRM